MTPQEQELVNQLFDRLAKLESDPRDPNAERLIADGLRRAPHAAYRRREARLSMLDFNPPMVKATNLSLEYSRRSANSGCLVQSKRH
jgi:Uncharacterized protein conserved in bacteria (DUF2076)